MILISYFFIFQILLSLGFELQMKASLMFYQFALSQQTKKETLVVLIS